MGKHFLKIFILFVPSLITFVLLGYCLLSSNWIQVKETELSLIAAKYKQNYDRFTGKLDDDAEVRIKPSIKLNEAKISVTTPSVTTSTMKTITMTPTPSEKSGSGQNLISHTLYDEDDDEDYENYGDMLGNDEASDVDYNDDDELKKMLKNKRKRDKFMKSQETPTSMSNKKLDFVYITQLWPLTKFKSLYSDCIEYKQFHLKLSASYLTQINKAPLIGSINYGADLTETKKQLTLDSINDNKQCDGRIGFIRCILNQQCVSGKNCDGIVDCEDQSDEQFCFTNSTCRTQPGGFHCDNHCWNYWQKCDLQPNCLNQADETDPSCSKKTLNLYSSVSSFNFNDTMAIIQQKHLPFNLGQSRYDKENGCYLSYFDFKSAQLIRKENLKYLSQRQADQIQETNNINYHLQLIMAMSFISALIFCTLALISLMFAFCFKKLCFQCPYWFYGFFQILCWLASLCGLMTFLYQWFINQQKSFDPYTRLPIENELIRLNPELLQLQDFGPTFWVALSATFVSFLGSFFSCLICCRLPSARHEEKEYKIMNLPQYS